MSASFDSVVMLTWSDWRSEPRSNRYHYAVRFARHAPVYFVQPDGKTPTLEDSGRPGVSIVHVPGTYGAAQLEELGRLLRSDARARPLLWVYNPRFETDALGGLRVFHATEDYSIDPGYQSEPAGQARYEMRKWRAELRADMVRMLGTCSLVVCVSEGVAAGLRRAFGYRGPLVVLENGCDFGFWSQAGAPGPARPRSAVYQGGMNERLDVPLIVDVMRSLPEWEFRFCGALSPTFAGMPRLLAEPNFRYLGMLSPEQLREELHAATAGIIPYVDDPIITERSLPLKAFEYAACGIPVVTVPIAALARLPRVFTFSRTAKDFARALTRAAEERGDPELIAERRAAAAAQDYDRRFEELRGLLAEAKVASAPGPSAAAAWRLAWYRACARWWAFRSWLEAKRQGLIARGILR